jgi:hypothetical protein
MARINLEGLRARDIRHGPGFVWQSATLVPADNYAVPIDAPPVLFMNPAGAIDVLLPTSNQVRKGTIFIFVNLSGNVITLKTDADAAFTTAITVAATASTRVICTGDSSQALGWRAW